MNRIHNNVLFAVFFGFIIFSLPVYLILKHPFLSLTRHVIAIAQMLYSAIIIHISGGRIETHFHIFGSLAFLSFYRDPKILITATITVGLDHLLRGIYFPYSVYGVNIISPFRWIEHVAWVLFEDVFLVIAILHRTKVDYELSNSQANGEINKLAIMPIKYSKINRPKNNLLVKLSRLWLSRPKLARVFSLSVESIASSIINP